MKLEAFAGRGRGDHAASHDLEDIVAITDAKTTLMDEIERSAKDLRDGSQARLPVVLDRLRRIAKRGT
jgi:hypothetical protein